MQLGALEEAWGNWEGEIEGRFEDREEVQKRTRETDGLETLKCNFKI